MAIYTLDYLTKENNKWYAHIRKHYSDGISRELRDFGGLGGISYTDMKKELLNNYNIEIPKMKELILFKQTANRKCYII